MGKRQNVNSERAIAGAGRKQSMKAAVAVFTSPSNSPHPSLSHSGPSLSCGSLFEGHSRSAGLSATAHLDWKVSKRNWWKDWARSRFLFVRCLFFPSLINSNSSQTVLGSCDFCSNPDFSGPG